MQKYNTPIPHIEDVEVVHVPVFQTEDYSPEVMAKYVISNVYPSRVELMSPGITGDSNSMPAVRRRSVLNPSVRRRLLCSIYELKAFMELYSQILDNGGQAFGEILRHVRDRPDDGCLFHCTGMFRMYIHKRNTN